MTDQAVHVTIATSTGLLHWVLVGHFGAGLVGLFTGFIALAVAKGARLHRQTGMIFAYAMITTGLIAAGLGAYEGKVTMIFGGLFTAYLVFTAVTTVRPVAVDGRRLQVAVMMVPFAAGLAQVFYGVEALRSPTGMVDGVFAPMIFFMGGIALLAGIGDLRMIRAGGIKGSRRIARHLWRMCFGLFIASGSFFLGQMKFLPKPLHIMPLVGGLAVAPLVALVYWMWRVRIRQSLRGIITTKAIEERQPA